MMSVRQGKRRRTEGNRAELRPMHLLAAMAGLIFLAGCHNDMWIQPKVKPYDGSDFFPNGQGMRQLPAHTVDRDHYWSDTERYLGYTGGRWVNGSFVGGKLVDRFPIAITRDDILRGQDRFNIYCSPCHGALGNGQGMIAQRGLALRRQPGNYHTDRLRKMPIGHFYDVITNGYGVMYSYAARVEPDDRWRIAAYIRVLQRSQKARTTDIPADLDAKTRQSLETVPPPAPTPRPGEVGAGSPDRPLAPAGEHPGATPPTDTGIPAPADATRTPNENGTNANGH